MISSEFLDPAARKRVSEAIAAVEKQTAAEIVVSVRKHSGHYRHADYLLGSLFALIGLLVFLFHPAPFDEDLFPVAEVAFFVAGVALSAGIAPLRRLLVASSVREQNVHNAARGAFVDQGISRTRDRTGILVYVALFEQKVEVVADIGVKIDQLGEGWGQAMAALQESLQQGGVARFLQGLERMGAPLGKALPRAADDINELSDEVRG